MRIAIVGTRGIPAKYGGFETFAEEISWRLAAKGFHVSVECDAGSYDRNNYNGVDLFFSSVTKSENPLRYYYEGIKWGIENSDIILVASSGGSIFYFLKAFKNTVILTNPDGLEYRRGKWSLLKKIYLKLSEILAVRCSDYIIADSEEIKKILCKSYPFLKRKVRLIEYGTEINTDYNSLILEEFNLLHNNYYLIVSRIEPENNLHVIIDGYLRSRTLSPLVVVGNFIENQYVKSIVGKDYSGRIRFPGGIYDKKIINPLRFSCKAYIHGHSVGGTNPSLLEAMGSGNVILAHDNRFNREVTAGKQFYFRDAEQLSECIEKIEFLGKTDRDRYRDSALELAGNKYSWNKILEKYLNLLNEIR